MCLNVINSIVPAQVSFLVLRLFLQLCFKLAFVRVESVCEKVKIAPCSAHIFLDFGPKRQISEIATPI